MKNMLVFALRHGERADRAPTSRPCPLQFDPCLTEKGLLQAEQSAQKISSMIPLHSKVHLVSSPFLRCIETASTISHILKIPIHIEEGFGELLFPWDFAFDPMGLLHVKSRGIEEIQREVRADLIENQHMTRATFPETHQEGRARVRKNWSEYVTRRDEDIVIVVSHLFVVGALSEVWLGIDYEIPEDGYCKLTVAEFNGVYRMLQCGDCSHADQ